MYFMLDLIAKKKLNASATYIDDSIFLWHA